MEYSFGGQIFELLPEKAMWHQDSETLFISDVHIDKIHHFRKNGISLPANAGHRTLIKLDALVKRISPKTIIFLGDLFHASDNNGVLQFLEWRRSISQIQCILVVGNHDVVTAKSIESDDILVTELYDFSGISCTHYPTEDHKFNLAGHLHPAVKLKGKGRQSIVLPCFFFSENVAVLPPFGYFTGHYIIKETDDYDIFCIAENKVIKVH